MASHRIKSSSCGISDLCFSRGFAHLSVGATLRPKHIHECFSSAIQAYSTDFNKKMGCDPLAFDPLLWRLKLAVAVLRVSLQKAMCNSQICQRKWRHHTHLWGGGCNYWPSLKAVSRSFAKRFVSIKVKGRQFLVPCFKPAWRWLTLWTGLKWQFEELQLLDLLYFRYSVHLWSLLLLTV